MEVFEKIARDVLSLVAFQQNDGAWWGMDTECGSDVEIVGEAVERIEQCLGITKCEECGCYEIPLASPFCQLPLCDGHPSVMVPDEKGAYHEVK